MAEFDKVIVPAKYNEHMLECIVGYLYPEIKLEMINIDYKPNQSTHDYMLKLCEVQRMLDCDLIMFK
jgi:hypothetical protein